MVHRWLGLEACGYASRYLVSGMQGQASIVVRNYKPCRRNRDWVQINRDWVQMNLDGV